VKKKCFFVEQIATILKQAELRIPVAELIRQVGVAEQTFTGGRRSTRGCRSIRSGS